MAASASLRGALLGVLLGAAAARAEPLTLDDGGDGERPLVRGPVGLEDVVRHLAALRGRGPPAAPSCGRRNWSPHTRSARGKPPRSRLRSGRSRARGRGLPAPPRATPRGHCEFLARRSNLVARHACRMLEEQLLQAELVGDDRAAPAGDDVRPQAGELPFCEVRVLVVQRARDRELEDAVAQEFEPLVRVAPVGCPRRDA